MPATSARLVRFGLRVACSEICLARISVALARSEVYIMSSAMRVVGESARLVRPAICVARIEVGGKGATLKIRQLEDPVICQRSGSCPNPLRGGKGLQTRDLRLL